MHLAAHFPVRCFGLVVVDIAPREYSRGHEDIFRAFFEMDVKAIGSRSEAEKKFEYYSKDFKTRQFILKNLVRLKEGGYGWKLNYRGIRSAYDQIISGLEPSDRYDGPTLFIRGGLSGYVEDSDFPLIRAHFPKAEILTIPGAGHWVHVDTPGELLRALREFMG